MNMRCPGVLLAAVGVLALFLAGPAFSNEEKNAPSLEDPVIVPGPALVGDGLRGASSTVVSSTDVPVSIPDSNPAGITSTLQGPNLGDLSDLNLIFDNLAHTCVADLRVELTSPAGTTAELILAFTEQGILVGLGCSADFTGTILDDQAATNLTSGSAPYTGSFNIEHTSVVTAPLSQFNEESPQGTWTLFVSDRAQGDLGTLNNWSLEFTAGVDIAVSVDENVDPVTAGSGAGNLAHTVNVSNSSTNPASGLEVTFPQILPGGVSLDSVTPSSGSVAGNVWTIGNLAAGASEALTLTMTAGSSASGSVSTSASWTALTETDFNSSNDSGAQSTSVSTTADIGVSKTGPATAVAGTQVIYDITVTNNGPSDAQSVSVADPVPAGYSFASTTAPCAGGFPCSIGTVVAGSSEAFSVTYDIDPATTGDVTNTATVSTSTADPTAGNDSAGATTTMNGEADLSIAKTSSSNVVELGQNVVYTIMVSNAGPSDATSVVVTDNLPTEQELVSTSGCTEDPNGMPICSLGTVQAGTSASYTLTATVVQASQSSQSNTASVTSNAADSNDANDSSTAGFTVVWSIPTLGPLGLIALVLMVTLVGGFQRRRLV